MTYKIIDLFCGAGGFSCGMEKAGFETILAIDLWDQAIETFNHNHNNKTGISIDINHYTNEMLDQLKKNNKIDGIIGGPPCQGFSMVGTRDRFDERNNLYIQYVRFVEQIKPSFFILENVKGLLTLEKGFFKKDILARFEKLGYNVNYKVLKASEFGVPQNRERVFFVGLSKEKFEDEYFTFPKPSKTTISTEMALSDLPSLDDNEDAHIYSKEPQNKYQELMRKDVVNNHIYNNEITKHTDKTKQIISLIPDGGNIMMLPEEYYKVRNYNAAFKRMNSQLPSTTIDCGHRNYFHYKENRVPTVREAARIQSFPDDFVLLGSKTSQYTQVGNAVPPLLAKKLGDIIFYLLSN